MIDDERNDRIHRIQQLAQQYQDYDAEVKVCNKHISAHEAEIKKLFDVRRKSQEQRAEAREALLKAALELLR